MRPNIQGPKKTRTLLLPPCVIALAISSSLVAAETTEPSITATQYAGGDKVAIRWRAGLEGTDRDCGHYAYESPYGDGTEYRNSGEHAIFARAPGGEYALAVNLRGTSDLMWFGGIGTYIKSSSETHTDVGDKANDAIRINGDELKAKVVGEGANLGVTQLGRIQFAEKGGLINTDFVDNSGGVNSSDLEVNIKIVLGEPSDTI